MPQVDHLGAGSLDEPPHDVDGGIKPIEQTTGGNNADLVLGDVGRGGDEGHEAKVPTGSGCEEVNVLEAYLQAMLRANILALFTVLAICSQAQTWCPPGAEWLFNFYSQQATGVRRAWYSGDTLVGGLPCQRIDQTIIAYEPIPPFGSAFIQQDQPIITHGQGDLLRIWDQANNVFDTLAWFSAVPGDRWNVPHYEFSGACYFEVLDTGTRVVAGIPLRFLVVEEPIVMGFVDTLFERIGFERFYVRPIETMLIDLTTTGLVCYRDDVLGQVDGGWPWHPCDFSLSLEEESAQRAQPFPNPGSDHFTISLAPGVHTIALFDATGREVLRRPINSERTAVDCSALEPGLFAYRLLDRSGTTVDSGKWIKE